MVIGQKQSARGFVKWAVVDAETQAVIRDSGPDWIPNLILNVGMNQVYNMRWCDLFLYAIAGTGTAPTSFSSGVTTAVQSTTAVTCSGGSFTFGPADVGNVIKWTSGESALITAYNNVNSVTVDNSQTVPSATFVMYVTSQTGLINELKRTNTYLTGAPNCQSSFVGNELQSRRTYDFSAEGGTVNYTEVGFSWAASGASTTFSRILLPSPVQVLTGQQLRLVYELRVTIGPTAPVSKDAIVNGWPISPATGTHGSEQAQCWGLSAVNSSGATTFVDVSLYGNEPGVINDPGGTGLGNAYMFISTSAAALASIGSATQRTGVNPGFKILTKASYITNSFYCDKSGTFTVGEANGTLWRSIGTGYAAPNNTFPYDSNKTAIAFIFDEAQTKPNTHTLTLTWRTTWSRTLS